MFFTPNRDLPGSSSSSIQENPPACLHFRKYCASCTKSLRGLVSGKCWEMRMKQEGVRKSSEHTESGSVNTLHGAQLLIPRHLTRQVSRYLGKKKSKSSSLFSNSSSPIIRLLQMAISCRWKERMYASTFYRGLDTNTYCKCTIQQVPLVAVEPRRPPMTNVGTEAAFRHGHCKHFHKSNYLLGSEVSWCNHRLAQTPKEAFSEVRVHAGGFLSWQPATCRFSTRRSFDHHGKGNCHFIMTVQKEFKNSSKTSKRVSKKWKKVKLVRISHWPDSDEKAVDWGIALDCVKLSVQTW